MRAYKAIPLADHGFIPCHTERNPVRWYVERWADDPAPLGPYKSREHAEAAAGLLTEEFHALEDAREGME